MLRFEVDDFVFSKITPMKGVIRFGNSDKLAPHYIRSFPILQYFDRCTYRGKLPNILAGVHDLFHVSHLHRCVRNTSDILETVGG